MTPENGPPSSRLHLGVARCSHLCVQRLLNRRRARGDVRAEGRAMPALISRRPQRALAVTALVVAAMIGGGIWLAQSGRSAAAPDVSIVRASRGDVVVSVGGVGRIVTNGVSAIELPASSRGP